MMSWNTGKSKFCNKRDEILITLPRFNPDIFAIHEANYRAGSEGTIIGYNIEYNTLYSNNIIAGSLLIN